MNRQQFFRMTRNKRRRNRKSRRASKRSRPVFAHTRRLGQKGGDWGFHISPSAIVGRTNEEGVQGFKPMSDVLEEKATM